MNLRTFLDFVEIRTKVASLIPYILGILFAYYRYDSFGSLQSFVFFVSLISLDMATTAINNYEGSKTSENFNPVKDGQIGRRKAITTILLLLMIAVSAGLYLVFLTDYVILVIGIISVCIAILYSFGPVPLSATPFGEIVSGGFMGFAIFFVALYIQVPDASILYFNCDGGYLTAQFNLNELVPIIFISLPLVLLIFNIMLANNICDVEGDQQRNRFTLPFFLGTGRSVALWIFLYGLAYIVILTGVLLGIIPVLSLLVFLSLIPNIPLIKGFAVMQDKQKTFINSIKVFLTISGFWIFSFIFHFLFKEFL